MAKTYFILATIEDGINLADVVRVLEFYKFKSFRVVTYKKYSSFFKQFNQKKILDIKKFNVEKNKKNIINLIFFKNISDCYWDINKHIKGKFDKRKSYHILKSLAKKNNYIHKSEKIVNKKIIKVGFNYIVPEVWKIKSYPQEKWDLLENKIQNLDKKKFLIEYQPKLSTVPYIKWIKSCDIIISVVGFGIHIASYFDKKIIMLSGPTDHYDYRKKNKIKKIYPEKRCFVHKRRLYLKNVNCNCMKNINPEKVFKTFKKFF